MAQTSNTFCLFWLQRCMLWVLFYKTVW